MDFFADYNKEDAFGVFNSLSVLIGGFLSNFVAGQISDRYESRMHKIKPWTCVIMSLLGIVTNSLCYMTTFNFYFSMSMQFLTYLLAEGWMSQALSMIQFTIDAKYKGVAVACFLCATAMFGSLGIFVVGQLEKTMNIDTQEQKGKLIAANTAIPCLIASICFYISGIYYGRVK